MQIGWNKDVLTYSDLNQLIFFFVKMIITQIFFILVLRNFSIVTVNRNILEFFSFTLAFVTSEAGKEKSALKHFILRFP